MSMHQILAEFYNTNGVKTAAANREDIEKAAQIELFTKIAAENNIDLSKLSDEQTQQLFVETFGKTAGEMPPQFAAHAKGKEEGGEKGEKEELEEKAKKEHEEKKASATKLAEADFMGRAMAHAYVNELTQIAAAREKTAGRQAPAAEGAWEVPLPKVASAIDALAMPRAFEMVQQHNAQAMEHNKTAAADKKIALFDEKDAATKIAAVHTKGLAESVKVAAAQDHKIAVEVRALETLEAAGFPVDWGT